MSALFQIPLSVVVAIAGSTEAFDAAVLAHRDELEAHRLGKPGKPAPLQHEIIDRLVLRIQDTGPVAQRKPDTFAVAEYEIVDDTPPPPTLEERKGVLVAQLHAAAAAARAALLSPAQANLLALDAAQASTLPEENRSPSERAAIEAYSAYVGGCSDIEHAAARIAVAIEGLTEASIDSYALPSL